MSSSLLTRGLGSWGSVNQLLVRGLALTGGGGGGSGPVDTFTDTAGTALTGHTPTPDGGFTWTDVGLGGINSWLISDANRARPNATGEVIYYADSAPASADYSTKTTVYVKDVSGGFVGVGVRQDASIKKGYYAIYNVGAGQWQLYWIDGGSFELLGTSYSQVLSPETGYHLDLDASGTSLTVKIDGTTRITATDSRITAAGYRSIYASGAATNTTGLHLDNFGQDYSAPVTSNGAYYYALLLRRRRG